MSASIRFAFNTGMEISTSIGATRVMHGNALEINVKFTFFKIWNWGRLECMLNPHFMNFEGLSALGMQAKSPFPLNLEGFCSSYAWKRSQNLREFPFSKFWKWGRLECMLNPHFMNFEGLTSPGIQAKSPFPLNLEGFWKLSPFETCKIPFSSL